MDSVNKTLYIPLYGKAQVSRKGIILRDPKSEEIWAAEGFALKGKAASKWLAYYMGMRAKVFDSWLEESMIQNPGSVILHIGCGMDSRISRVNAKGHQWYDIDFPEVIRQRKRHYASESGYTMIGSDARNTDYLQDIPGDSAIVIMEGISMYLSHQELQDLFAALSRHFGSVRVLMDCYTDFAARASKYKNPVNEVGVTTLYGLDDPKTLESSQLRYVREHSLTPQYLIDQLSGMERVVFQKLYAGTMAKKLYRLYEFSSKRA